MKEGAGRGSAHGLREDRVKEEGKAGREINEGGEAGRGRAWSKRES